MLCDIMLYICVCVCRNEGKATILFPQFMCVLPTFAYSLKAMKICFLNMICFFGTYMFTPQKIRTRIQTVFLITEY